MILLCGFRIAGSAGESLAVFVLLLLLHSLFILEEWTGKSGMTPIEFRYQKTPGD
jgi:hypothetical protein